MLENEQAAEKRSLKGQGERKKAKIIEFFLLPSPFGL
jgi:hypothetical protein